MPMPFRTSNPRLHKSNSDQNLQTYLSQASQFIAKECTFYRVHLFAFTFIPLIFSGIFYASNGRFHIDYLDSLFLCYSAMTVTGLSTVNLSTLTAWQQVLLYVLMMMGDITMVSWTMVLVRKSYFRSKCEYVDYVGTLKRSRTRRLSFLTKSRTIMLNAISSPVDARPMHNPLDPIDKYPENPGVSITGPTPKGTLFGDDPQFHDIHNSAENGYFPNQNHAHNPDQDRILSDARTFSSSPRAATISLDPMSPTSTHHGNGHGNVEFGFSTSITPSARLNTIREGVPFAARRLTMLTNRTARRDAGDNKKYNGYGGFPGPITLAKRAIKRTLPTTYRKVERKLTMPYTTTLNAHDNVKKNPWLDFDGLVVGRNSDFHTETLSDEQLEKIGGAEYRALRLLSYLVPCYFVGTQLIAFLLFAPWISTTTKYDSVFEAQPRIVQKPWFALFQTMGAYTGGGLSLVDLGMVPFQSAYLMIFALIFVILAGNHALPIFLRLIIWIGSKIVPEGSDPHQALTFLLDHPRRCFVYLFPSHQTWFLVILLIGFSIVEWIAFEVLNIGLEVYETISIGPRIVAGLFQGLAARASGFSIVSLSALAPALQFMYVVMMYIAVYPVAMSIRATNVYEERSLGVFEDPPDDEDDEPEKDLAKLGPRERVGRYVGWHLRRQLSIDIWWLVWAVFIVAIVERDNLMDDDKKWFDLFRVLFELVSAFGGIGLSLGLPTDNFAFAGAMRPLSKLVIIVIMVRGRHRGLPLAVDRAVLLPNELVVQTEPKSKAEDDTHNTNGVA